MIMISLMIHHLFLFVVLPLSNDLHQSINHLHRKDAETIKDTCWGLSYIADGSPDNVQAVVDSGVGPRLVQLLSATNVDVQLAALRTGKTRRIDRELLKLW